MHLVPDSEPICAILAVSHIHFLRSQKLHIGKSNSLEAACERLEIEVIRPEAVVLERPIHNHSVSQFSEPLQLRGGGAKSKTTSLPTRIDETIEVNTDMNTSRLKYFGAKRQSYQSVEVKRRYELGIFISLTVLR